MFMVISKDRIASYLISLSTVMILFVMSFAITNSNNEIIKTSANITSENNIENTMKTDEIQDEESNDINKNITNILQK